MGQVHNSIKYDSQLLKALALGVGVSPDEAGVERLSESLTAIVNAYSVHDLPEWQIMRGVGLAAMSAPVGPVAAENSFVALINPAGSNLLVVVDTISHQDITLSSSQFVLEVASEGTVRAIAPTTETRGQFRDRRRTVVTSRVTAYAATKVGAVGTEIASGAASGIVANGFFSCMPLILPPGQALITRDLVVNETIRVSYAWRERLALPGELNIP